jgi:hypothetical protein
MSAVPRLFMVFSSRSMPIPGEGKGKAVLEHAMMVYGGGVRHTVPLVFDLGNKWR